MRRSIKLAAVTAALFLLLPAAIVQAAVPAGVTFTVLTTFDPNTGVSSGPFTATGPAVESGLVCATGTTVDVAAMVTGYKAPPAPGVNFHLLKQFTCDDGSGAFLVRLEARADAKGDNFHWIVAAGSDAYATLRGEGSGYGTFTGDPSIVIDTYEGGLHLD